MVAAIKEHHMLFRHPFEFLASNFLHCDEFAPPHVGKKSRRFFASLNWRANSPPEIFPAIFPKKIIDDGGPSTRGSTVIPGTNDGKCQKNRGEKNCKVERNRRVLVAPVPI